MSLLDRVLFVGAHTDDIELFAGGLLHRVIREEGETSALTFSSHKGVTNHVKAAAEHQSNMLFMDTPHVLYGLSACNGEFQTRRQFVFNEVLASVNQFSPTLVVTHQRGDSNQDHVTVTEEVIRALKGRCSIWGGEYPMNAVGLLEPDVFVALHPVDINAKLQLIATYQSQRALNRHYLEPALWQGLASMRGAQIGHAYAEAFRNIRTSL